MLQQAEARPLSDRKFQAVSDDRLISHRAAMRRWVDWHAKKAPIDQPSWKPSAASMSCYFQSISRNGPTCLRYHHLQRSCGLQVCFSFLRATCRKGQRRVQQTQPPFDWACPAVLPFGLYLAAQVLLDCSEAQRALGRDPNFIVHDYDVPKGSPLTAESKRRLTGMELSLL